MATIVLGAVGGAVGASFGGAVMGLSGAVIGRAAGATLGRVIDQRLMGAGSQLVESGRLDRLRLTGAAEGAPVRRVWGRVRIGGQVIWASRFIESRQQRRVGGKGGPRIREYSYSVSLAVALCEGEITGIGRIWADGAELSPDRLDLRVYRGDAAQMPDPKIEAVEGPGQAPAYRGIAYVVIEGLDLGPFGNRVPQFSFEVLRSAEGEAVPDLMQGVRAVALIPGTGEFSLSTEPIAAGHADAGAGLPALPDPLLPALAAARDGGRPANVNTATGVTDLEASLRQLTTELPNCRSVLLVVSWFGDDLRCGVCSVRPKVENAEDAPWRDWEAGGIDRAAAEVVPLLDGRAVYGGTPSDRSVLQAIAALHEAGQAVVFYPFLLMEQMAGNTLPDPWSGATGQPVLPWRGRITASVAPGRPGTPDRSAAAADEVAAFFGAVQPEDFALSGDRVVYSGPAEDWGYRRFILHYAWLAKLAGGVDAFCVGSELRGLTQLRGAADSFPAVEALCQLAADVRSILGAEVKISYAADWSEYFGYQSPEGGRYFHLDEFWADANVDFIGIDNYMPMSDWREGEAHADAQDWPAIHDLEYLKANIAGGEGYDWFYASDADRVAQLRSPITDGWGGPDDARFHARHAPLAGIDAPTDLLRAGSVLFHCRVRLPATPADGRLFGIGGSGAALWVGLRDGGATLRIRAGATGSGGQGRAILDLPTASLPMDGALHDIAVEVVPGPVGRVRFWLDRGLWGEDVTADSGPLAGGVWAEAAGGGYLGAEGTVPAGEPAAPWPAPEEAGDLTCWIGSFDEVWRAEPWVYRYKALREWWSKRHYDRPGGVRGTTPTAWEPGSKPVWFTEIGCAAVDKGTNAPNLFLDAKSSESRLPPFSTGRRDDLIQQQYHRALIAFWSDPANNPVSAIYGDAMVDMTRAHVWAWDARPFPAFPALHEVWSDGDNWARGHWITGRVATQPLASVVAEICRRAGLQSVDVSRLYGLVRGLDVASTDTARSVLQTLMLSHGFEAVERAGTLFFQMRGARPAAQLTAGELVARDGGDVEVMRAAEPEVAGRVRLLHIAAEGDFEVRVAEAAFADDPGTTASQSELPLVLTGAEAQGIAERWLAEARVARDSLRLSLPSSSQLGAGDVFALDTGAEARLWRIDRVDSLGALEIEAVRVEPELYLPAEQPGDGPRQRPFALPAPLLPLFLDLPLITDAQVPHAPHLAITAGSWTGPAAVFDAVGAQDFRLNRMVEERAAVGVTETPLMRAAPGLWDRGAPLRVRMFQSRLQSEGEAAVLAGANALAIGDGRPEAWEILQFRDAELVAPGVWELSHRLRGQLGTEADMPEVWPAGSLVVLLDPGVVQVELPASARGLARRWRIGPAELPHDDATFFELEASFTGRGLRPYAPAHLRARREADGTLELGWLRRTRIDGDSWAGVEVPLGEAEEAYVLRVLKGAEVLRETVLPVPHWRYEADDQQADGAIAPFRIAVAQLSQSYGPGPFTEVAIDD